MRRRCLALVLFVVLGTACGLPPPLPLPGSAKPTTEEVAPDSPRGSVTEYLRLAQKEQFTEAARYLDLAPEQLSEGPLLARHLKTVLDYYVWIEPLDLSPLPTGSTSDDLPAGVDAVGAIPVDGRTEPVRIVRKETPDGARWVFSRATVGRVEGWYEGLPDHWIRETLPPVLLESGPLGLFRWQWIGLPVLVLASIVAGHVLRIASSVVLRPLLSRAQGPWGTELVPRLGGPLALTYALLVASVLLRRVALHPPAEAVLQRTFRIGEIVVLFWGTLRILDVFILSLERHLWDPAARSILQVLSRTGKMVMVALFAVTILAAFDVPVASVLAGLGIGGLGIALAAQKTVENLFGSFSLTADRAIRVGDAVQIDQLSGTVESIGLRSTRIRTADRTLVTVPNGKLSEVRIESLTARDRFRLACILPLVYATPAAPLRGILQKIEAAIRAQPSLHAEDLIVCFREIGSSSFNLEINATFALSLEEFRKVRQDLLLAFLEIIESEGSALAFPTQTIRLDTPPGPHGQGAS